MSLKPLGVYVLVTNPDLLALKEKKLKSGLILTAAVNEANERLTKSRIAKVIAIGDGIHDGKIDFDPHEELSIGDYVVLKPHTAKEIVKDREKGLSILVAHFEEILVKIEDFVDEDVEEQFKVAQECGY